MYVDNKKAIIILAVVIVISLLVILFGKTVANVKVTSKNLKVDEHISEEIDKIVQGNTVILNEEQSTLNETYN